MFKVFSCVIYTIISKIVCIDYLGHEKKKLSDLRPGPGGSYKHFNKIYDIVLRFGVPGLLINFVSCRGFMKNNDYVVVIKFSNRMFEYYLNKGFIFFIVIKTI